MGYGNVNWEELYQKLPTERDPASRERRQAMFNQFDPNGNGVLSLAEVDKAIRDVLAIDAIFDAKPPIMRAFQIAKNCTKSTRSDGVGPDYIEFLEFRYFLRSLRQYFEYWVAFKRIDDNDDRRLNFEEFKDAMPEIRKWVGAIKDPKAEFNIIDKNGGGMILFDEFVSWAFSKNLDLDDDDDA